MKDKIEKKMIKKKEVEELRRVFLRVINDPIAIKQAKRLAKSC